MVLWSNASTLDRKSEGSNPAANYSFEANDLDARRKEKMETKNRRARERPLTHEHARKIGLDTKDLSVNERLNLKDVDVWIEKPSTREAFSAFGEACILH